MKSRAYAVLLLGMCCCTVFGNEEKQELPALQPKQYSMGIAPSHITVPSTPLLKSTQQWKTVADRTTLYKYYGVQLINTKWATKLDARALAEFSKRENIQLGCEFGDFHLGEKRMPDLALSAFRQLDPIFEAGGTVSSIHLDGPIRRMLKGHNNHPNALELDAIAEKLVNLCQAIRAKYPDIRIGLITNLPNWDYTKQLAGYNGHFTDRSGVTYLEALNKVHQALTAAGEKIDFIEIDCPYNYYQEIQTRKQDAVVDNGAKLTHLHQWCKERSLPFHLVVNAEPRKQGGQGFHDLTCQYIKHLRRDGIFPEMFIIQSWYKEPKQHLPETKQGTFMNTARDAMDLIQKLYPAK